LLRAVHLTGSRMTNLTQIIFGERIGKGAPLRLVCNGTLFDASRQKILLTRRADNGQWCIPGGGVDPGEDVSEACVREMFEETGLHVQVLRLIGIYSSPDCIIQYFDGRRFQIVALNFEVEAAGGALTLNSEVTEFGYFDDQEIASLDLVPIHHIRIQDAYRNQAVPFIR
jgi:8-oxo-dGTP pyrophosphatase MutT (NUDIX family)